MTRTPLRGWLLATLAVVASLQAILVNYWPAFPSPNERPRAYQALSVVDGRGLAIDAEIERYGWIEDLSRSGGRLYPNKAPGLLPLLLPAAAAARLLAPGDPELRLALTLVLGRWLAASLPFLLTLLLLAHVTHAAGAGGRLIVVSLAVGSPLLAGSLLLFSHALAALLLLAAFALLERAERPGAAALAGLALGWAVVSEYPLLLPAAVLALAFAWRGGWRAAVALAAGAAPPALLLAAYNHACFGSPLALSSALEASPQFAQLTSTGVFGVSWPRVAGLAGLLGDPARGLLLFAPLLALALAPWYSSAWQQRGRRIVLGLAAVTLLIAMSGYPNWHGGWFPGPRYLLAVVPLAAILAAGPAARLLERAAGRVVLLVSALWGVAMLWPCLASFPMPPEDYPLPALTLALPLLGDGVRAPALLPAPLLLPALVLLAAVTIALLARAAGARALEVGVAIALVAAALAVVPAAPPVSWQAALERAVIRDVYAGPRRGALEGLRPRASSEGERRQLESWIARREQALTARD